MKITQQIAEDAARRYFSGDKIVHLAKEYNVTSNAISKAIRRCGVTKPAPIGIRDYEEKYGLHPYDKLCYGCRLNECKVNKRGCLQTEAVRASGFPKSSTSPESWKRKTEIMVAAGMACLVGELPELFNIDVSKYKQVGMEELFMANIDLIKL